jgi:2-polyprenyl-3-methyl-5-hydroxy-6-metoxy-1,4-benzoquinol methylase
MASVIAGLIRARELRAFFGPHVTRERPCPVCESTDARHLLSGDRDFIGIHTAQCVACRMIFSSPFYGPAVVEEFYRGTYRSVFKGQPDPKEFIARQAYLVDRARFFLALFEQEGVLPASGGTLLDVGSGEGTLLRAARDARPDLRLRGVEPTISYRANAEAETGVAIAPGMSELERGTTFELITCIHVLEHVRQPLELLQQMRERLAPGGWCYIDVPDAAAYSSVDELHVAHCNHFTAHTLGMAVEHAGMVVRRIRAHRPPSLPPSLLVLAQRDGKTRREITPDPEGERLAERLAAMRVGRFRHMTRRARALIARRVSGSGARR